MAKQQPIFTTAEEIESLIRINVPTKVKVYVEGSDDVLIFNSISNHKSLGGKINFIGRGGRSGLLELYEHYVLQKARISQTVLFFADQDTWVFTGIPPEFIDIHLSQGYCIENDLFEDGKEAIISLLYNTEKERFIQLLKSVCEWFAREVNLILDGNPAEGVKIDVSLLNPNFIALGANEMNESYQIDAIFRTNESELINKIQTNYTKYLRGKFLFDLFEILRQDRIKEKGSLPIPQKDSLFSICVAEGMRKEDSHSHRIATILQNVI